jgi:Arc/MetJ-type ribon-helix-helix transcriptional regulator
MHESKVTVKIPRPLYRKIQLVIENAGFSSPTDFIVFVLRDLLGEAERKGTDPAAALAARAEAARVAAAAASTAASAAPAAPIEHHEEFSAHDLESVKQKLRNLGYL